MPALGLSLIPFTSAQYSMGLLIDIIFMPMWLLTDADTDSWSVCIGSSSHLCMKPNMQLWILTQHKSVSQGRQMILSYLTLWFLSPWRKNECLSRHTPKPKQTEDPCDWSYRFRMPAVFHKQEFHWLKQAARMKLCKHEAIPCSQTSKTCFVELQLFKSWDSSLLARSCNKLGISCNMLIFDFPK